MDVLPIVDSWIVGGDFNNVDTYEDWCAASSPALPRIARSERDAWDLFLFALAGADAWHVSSLAHRPNSLQFSWGFHRQQGLLLKRLDRFYVGHWAISCGGSVSIWPSTTL